MSGAVQALRMESDGPVAGPDAPTAEVDRGRSGELHGRLLQLWLMLIIGHDESTGWQPGTHERSEAQMPGEFPAPIGLDFECNGGAVPSFTLATGSRDETRRIEFKSVLD